MMKFIWHSPNVEVDTNMQSPAGRADGDVVPYSSRLRIESQVIDGVVFTLRKISLGMRMELMRKIREISRRMEFLAAGDDLQERIEANLLAHEIDATYMRWGLVEVTGLDIDGEAATAELLIEKGPDELAKEIVAAIRSQSGLNDAERKN
jgi:hypothetical protein